MTRAAVLSWLASRTPVRPPELAEYMSLSVSRCPQSALAAAPTIAEAMGLLGTWTLASITADEPPSGSLALDLLSADAFVTYAFEAAAEEGLPIGPLALHLLKGAA